MRTSGGTDPLDPLDLATRHYFWKPYMAYFAAFELNAYLEAGWAPTGCCLDVGCREGTFTQMLKELVGFDAQLIGVDTDLVNVRTAANRRELYQNVVGADAARMPFEDGTFDSVMANAVFYCLRPDASQAAREVRRVLKRGGSFVCTVPTSNVSEHYLVSERLERLRLNGISKRYQTRVYKRMRSVSLLTPAEWEGVLGSAGLIVEKPVGYISAATSRRWSAYLEIPRVLSLLRSARSAHLRAFFASLLRRSMATSYQNWRGTMPAETGDYVMFVCKRPDAG